MATRTTDRTDAPVGRLFLSYAREDYEALQVVLRGARGLGYEVWLDKELRGGQDWWDEILDQIRACDAMLLALSPHFCVSPISRLEWRYAQDLNKPLLPVAIGPIPASQLPRDLAHLQYVSVGPELESAFSLARALRALPAAEPLPDPLPDAPLVPIPIRSLTQWVVLGAGRLGLGFLSPIAQELGIKPLLFVAGRQTSQDIVRDFNAAADSGAGYRVECHECDKLVERVQVVDYSFGISADTQPLIDAIADPRTVVLSTSVGGEQLPRVAPVVAQGLRQREKQRAASLESSEDTNRLLILVCENGRSADGLEAAQSFARELEALLEPGQLVRMADIPRTAIDAIVPERGGPGAVTLVSRGALWVEDTALVRKLIGRSSSVRVVPVDDIALIHTRKLYCFNTLHCLLSAFGHFTGEPTLDRVASDENLGAALGTIVEALIGAVCQRHGVPPDVVVGGNLGESTRDYGLHALRRLQHPPWASFDKVSRALKGLGTGRYLRDGRIDGPLIDAGLVEEPDRSAELVHALSLCMYYVVSRLDQVRQRFLWLPANCLRRGPDGSCLDPADIPVFAKAACFGEDNADSRLMEAMARDFVWLGRHLKDDWSTVDLAKYLGRTISGNLPVLPRRFDRLRLVVFDVDEGLVATESLLYEVTREMICDHSRLYPPRPFTLDDYVSDVGRSETSFFDKIRRGYAIDETPAELASEREARYQARLQSIDPCSLLKPRFRDLLERLRREPDETETEEAGEKRVKVAVYSNASQARIETTLRRVGVFHYFDAIATPGPGIKPKPSPDMLVSLQRKFEVDPRDCLVVESSRRGVTAAVAAGCFTILLVNDYTAPGVMPRRGVEVLPNSQALAEWLVPHLTPHQ